MKSVIETSLYLVIMAWICVISVQFILMNGKITKVNEISTYIENFVEAKGEGNSEIGTKVYYKTYTYKNIVKIGLINKKDADGKDVYEYLFRDEAVKKQFKYDDTDKSNIIFQVTDINNDGTIGNYKNISIDDENYKYILDYKDFSKYETWYSSVENDMPYTCVFKKDDKGNSMKDEIEVMTTASDFNSNKGSINNFDYIRVFIHYSDEFKAQLDQLINNYKKQGYDIAFSYYDTTNDYGYISYSINYSLAHSFLKFSTNHKFNGIARFPITGVVGSY